MSKKKGTILIADDNKGVLDSIRLFLKQRFENVLTVADPGLIPTVIRNENSDVVLLDMNFSAGVMTGNEGIYWLKRIIEQDPSIVVVMITAYGDIELAVKAMKEGAFDFIVKPWDNKKLYATVNAALQLRQSRREVAKLKNQKQLIQSDANKHFKIFRGTSPEMNKIFETISKVAVTDANVLITGENGTGKELIAREIHRMSKRSQEIFMPVDLGSITETLFESEMFGHVKGAFTNAEEDRTGRLESASGGTCFLDEISNASLAAQAKLLTALERKSITPVGSNREIPVDIRLVCASNKNLKTLVEKELFREDLFYRINTVEIALPPLRERKEDIPTLAESFLEQFKTKYGKHHLKIGRAAHENLQSYQWPGNVRELKHAVERAVILGSNEVILPGDLSLGDDKVSVKPGYEQVSLREAEKKAIQNALYTNRGNISEAARQLQIPRQRLYRKIKKYDLEVPLN